MGPLIFYSNCHRDRDWTGTGAGTVTAIGWIQPATVDPHIETSQYPRQVGHSSTSTTFTHTLLNH